MNKLTTLMKNNLWTIAFALVTTLYIFLFAINSYGITAERVWCCVAFFVIVTTVCMLCDGWRKNAVQIAVTVVSFAPNIVAQSFLLMNHTILKSTDYWVIFDTNPEEASGFFSGVPAAVLAYAGLYIALLALTLCMSIKSNRGRRIPVFIQYIAAFALAACCLIQPFRR